MPPAPSKIYPQWGCSFCERSYITPNLVTRHQDGYLTEYAKIYLPDGATTTFRASAHPLPVLRYVRHEADRHPGVRHADIVWGEVDFRPWVEPVDVMVRLDDVDAKRRHAEEFRYLSAMQWVGRLGEIVPVKKQPIAVADEEEDEDEEDEDEDEEEDENDKDEDEDEDDEGIGGQPDNEDEQDADDLDNEHPESATSSTSSSTSSSSAPSSPSPAPTTPSRRQNLSFPSHLRSDRPIANSTVIGKHYQPISTHDHTLARDNTLETGNARSSMAVLGRNASAKWSPRKSGGRRSGAARRRANRRGETDDDNDDGEYAEATPLRAKGGGPPKRAFLEPGPAKRMTKSGAKRVFESSSTDASPVRPRSKIPARRTLDIESSPGLFAAPEADVAANSTQDPSTPAVAPAARLILSSAARTAQFYTPGNTMPIFLRLSIELHAYAPPWIVPIPATCSLAGAVALVRDGLTERGIGGEGYPGLVGLEVRGRVLDARAWEKLLFGGGVVGVLLVWSA